MQLNNPEEVNVWGVVNIIDSFTEDVILSHLSWWQALCSLLCILFFIAQTRGLLVHVANAVFDTFLMETVLKRDLDFHASTRVCYQ